MYLKSITAGGFKSFADKINITLDNNITCIVGPNGSGKSNIVDAIRWVLGEQSVKSLRGTSSMSDVIFSGSKTRNGASRAEVTLTFNNEDHYLNTDFKEVEVRRVLYKNGDSEYFINNAHVRLKDITDLFLDTGSSIDSFNIISQGSIEGVVNSKPIDRRIIFESAAGVVKYKKRKEESLRALKSTKENIDKVNLIIDEVKERIEPLKEQSDVAKKYLSLKEELSTIEIATNTYEITTLNEEYNSLKNAIEILNKKLLETNSDSGKEGSTLEKLKLENVKLDEEITKTNAKLLDLTSKFMDLQNDKNMYLERKKYGENASLDTNILNLKEEINENDKMVELLSNDLKNLELDIKKREDELRNINEEQSYSKIKRNSLINTRNENLKNLFELKNKKDIINANIASDSKTPNSVKSILNNPRITGVHNTIGKLLEVSEEYSKALEVALGASTNFLVVDNEDVAKCGINYLKNNKLGRVTFFPLNIIKERFIPEEDLKKIEGKKGFLGTLDSLVSYETKYQNIIKNQIGNVIVVDNIDTMNEFGTILNHKYRLVSLDGDIMHAGGSISGGSLKVNSYLNDKKELDKIINQIKTIEENNIEVDKDLTKYDNDLKILNEKEETLNRNLINLRELKIEKNNIITARKDKLTEINKELEGAIAIKNGDIDAKLMKLLDLVNEGDKEKELESKKLDNLKEKKSSLVIKIEELERKYKEKNTTYNHLQNELKTKEIALGKLDIKLDNLLTTLNENYSLTYEKAKEDYSLDIELNEAKNKVNKLKTAINHLGEVNVYAIEEYEKVSTRYNFLTEQINDLNKSSTELEGVIKEMDNIMTNRFITTFNDINNEFKKVFKKLFKGGNGLLKLTDPDNILETGIDIIAEPPGKKLTSIGLLSGGEKTLTAISLLFAILNVKTMPFCILDEVEAALDEANVDEYGKYLQEQKQNSQFILITHKKRTMEYADTLYGITMQESGVSKIVSVKLENN